MTEPEKSKEIVVLEKKVAKIDISSLKIVDEETMLLAGEKRKEIKDYLKQAKDAKEEATKPLNGVLKTIRAWFAPLEDRCETMISQIEDKMNSYNRECRERQLKAESEAQKKIEEAAKKLEEGKITEKQAEKIVEKAEEKVNAVPAAVTGSNSFHTRKNKKVKFKDPTLIGASDLRFLVDSKYLIWDEVKARRDALAGLKIPGAEVYEEESLI